MFAVVMKNVSLNITLWTKQLKIYPRCTKATCYQQIALCLKFEDSKTV